MRRSVIRRQPWGLRDAQRVLPLVRAGYQAYKSYRNSGKKRNTERQVTAQHDMSTVYHRRRMPRRRRRRWVRQVRLHRRLNDLSLGTRNIIFKYDGAHTATAGNQGHITFCLYGLHGTSNTRGLNDLSRIIGTEGTANDQGISASVKNKKLHFKSAVMDCTLVNNADTVVELDMYYFFVTRNTDAMSNVSDAMTDVINNSSLITSTGSPFTVSSVGVTPFDCSNVAQYIKIYKVKKVILGTGQITSFMIRSAGDKYLNQDSVEQTSDMFGLKGYTKGVFIISKGAPNNTTGAPTDVSIHYHMQNKYHYTVDSKSGMAQQIVT